MEVLYPVSNPDGTERSINVDIVAVPGLGADPAKSFGSENTDFNWLQDAKDGIPDGIPGARVMLYHYDSRWLGSDAKEQTLYNVASLFLVALAEKRTEEKLGEPTRPIVFLAHSMGGLVVAKAMTLAATKPEEVTYTRILECFSGAIFFGTPFGGSPESFRGMLLAGLLENFNGKGYQSQMLQTLDPNRDSLNELRDDFVRLTARDPKPTIFCLYELKPTNYLQERFKRAPKLGSGEVVVSQQSATLNNTKIFGLGRNHRQLNRFDDAKDTEYKYVLHWIKEIVKSSGPIVKSRLRASRQSVVDDATFQLLVQSLNVVASERKLESVENLSGDSRWLLDEPDFQRWASQDPPVRCLWVSGNEGLGKSKAAAVAINNLKKKRDDLVRAAEKDPSAGGNIMFAYFFCDPSLEGSLAENLIKSLIWQLIVQKRELAQYVKMFAAKAPSSRGGGGAGGHFGVAKLWRGLAEMLQDAAVEDVYFVVANVHSLSDDDGSRTDFLTCVSEMLQGQDGPDGESFREKAKWMFLSRDRPDIKKALDLEEEESPQALRIDLNASSRSVRQLQFLATYTRDRVKALGAAKGYNLALQYFVFSSLVKRAESSTLWVDVVCSLLMQLPPTFVSVRETLQLLPQDVSELIEQVWAEVLGDSKKPGLETTKEILRTLVISYEDPTVEELAVLADLDNDVPEGTSVEARVLEQVKACGPMLRVSTMEARIDSNGYWPQETRVAFIHPMARTALQQPELAKYLGIGGEDEDGGTEFKWQHGIVGLRCFSYMMSRFAQDDENDDIVMQWKTKAVANKKDAEIDQLFDEVAAEAEPAESDIDEEALVYPLKYWLRHGYDATPEFVNTLDISQRFWSLDSTARKRWWGTYATKEGQGELKGLTALHVASFFGLLPLVNSLLDHGHRDEIHQLDNWDNQPLHWAAARGHTDVCLKLLEEGAEINNGLKTNVWTPLHMAASEGRLDVMKMLLEHEGEKADINAMAAGEGTPLTLALQWGQVEAAQFLVDEGADITLTADNGEAPLIAAILRGYEDLVADFLEKGSDPKRGSKDYPSALAAAATTGNMKIVRSLLALDEDLDSRGAALEQAAGSGFPAVITEILEQSESLPLGKALEKAAAFGQEAIVRLLWDSRETNQLSKEDVDTTLYVATDAQQDTIVQFLLATCEADPNVKGEEYGNALTASAYDGTTTIAKLLLQHGADPRAEEGYPLHMAAANGHKDIVTLLLDNGAEVNGHSTHCTGGSALQEACAVGDIHVARILLERGADPNYGSGWLSNPLTAAAYGAYGELVELLLEKGADPNRVGGPSKSSPLINASSTLPAKYVRVLLDHGANIDYQDEDGDTALMICAALGDDECVKVLLEFEADVNVVGKRLGTALHAAAGNGHPTTCRLLLEKEADPNLLGGDYHTIIQAAAASGNPECVKTILENEVADVELDVYGGKYYSAVHAAAVQENDKCLRQLLEREADLNVVPGPGPQYAKLGTPLHEAASTRCNRNARILLDAGADANIGGGKLGTVIQAATLKGDSALVTRLLGGETTLDGHSGKYGNVLVAAVARESRWNDDSDTEERHEIINLLLERDDLPPDAYKAAMERAVQLGRKEDFKLILTSYEAKAKKQTTGKFPAVKRIMVDLKKAKERQVMRRYNAQKQGKEVEEPANSDFGDDDLKYQDIDDVVDETETKEEEEAAQAEAAQTAQGDQSRGLASDYYGSAGAGGGTGGGYTNGGGYGGGGYAGGNAGERGFQQDSSYPIRSRGEPGQQDESGGGGGGGAAGFGVGGLVGAGIASWMGGGDGGGDGGGGEEQDQETTRTFEPPENDDAAAEGDPEDTQAYDDEGAEEYQGEDGDGEPNGDEDQGYGEQEY